MRAADQPYLTREQEQTASVDLLVRSHARLVEKMAYRFKGYGLEIEDLKQEGHAAVARAADTFNPETGRFATYAAWWVKAAMQDYVLRNWSLVRGGTSSAHKRIFFGLRRAKAKAIAKNPSAGAGEIRRIAAKALNVRVTDLELIDARLTGDLSLDAPISDLDGNSTTYVAMLADEGEPLEEQVGRSLDSARQSASLQVALTTLNPRERAVIQCRFLREDPCTLDVLGTQFGISKERVRQIEVRAIEKLRTAMGVR